MPAKWWAGFAAVVVAAVMLGAGVLWGMAALGRQIVEPGVPGTAAESPATPPASPGEPTAPGGAPAGFVEFRDERAGFAVSYPQDWTRYESPDPQVVLVVSPNQRDSFQVRVVRLGFVVGPEEFPELQRFTDEIVSSSPGVELLGGPCVLTDAPPATPSPPPCTAPTLDGLPGYFYFYRFADEPSGQVGAHSHYFVFKGDLMVTLVFQALPAEEFPRLAPVFDTIANSFRVLS